MGYEFWKICKVETRRLLWLIGAAFAMVLVVQYLELPYGNVLSTLFSASKVSSEGSFHTRDLSTNSSNSLSQTLHGFNISDANVVHGTPNMTMSSIVKERSPKTDSVLIRNESSADPPDSDVDVDPENESTSSDITEQYQNSTVVNMEVEGYNSSAPANSRESEYNFAENATTDKNNSLSSVLEENIVPGYVENGRLNVSSLVPLSASTPTISTPLLISPENVDTKPRAPLISLNPNNSLLEEGLDSVLHNNGSSDPSLNDHAASGSKSSMVSVHIVNDKIKKPAAAVESISEMNDMLLQSRTSFRSMKPRWPSLVDQELLNIKSLVESAPIIGNDLYAPLYRNISVFRRSYELMEQKLKVYIYAEGDKPIFHQPVLKGIYASEGWFMKLLKANKKFVTKNSRKAHLFYLPFSSRMLEETLYVPNSHNHKNLVQYLNNYVKMIVAKYPSWNRTGGSDHFFVACHDWAPSETRVIMAKCIRALCNSDIKEGFTFGKDVSLPETYVKAPQHLQRERGGKPHSQRQILAFFAGNMHGYLRPILLKHWENKDPDMKIFGMMSKVKGQMSYVQHMKSSKYCICAKGYEVNSPRVVEAIFYECVPVIISDNFVPPFFEVLNWESFAVFVLEKDIPNLKNILLSISKKRYLEMYQRVKQVQHHFLWHAKPVKYDIFHMILHSIWYNRVLHVNSR